MKLIKKIQHQKIINRKQLAHFQAHEQPQDLAMRAPQVTTNTTHNNITSKKQTQYSIQTSEHK